jgi:hypothetical protein
MWHVLEIDTTSDRVQVPPSGGVLVFPARIVKACVGVSPRYLRVVVSLCPYGPVSPCRCVHARDACTRPSTVGYGDIFPKSSRSRMAAVVVGVCGLGFMGAVVEVVGQRRAVWAQRVVHRVLSIGGAPLSLRDVDATPLRRLVLAFADLIVMSLLFHVDAARGYALHVCHRAVERVGRRVLLVSHRVRHRCVVPVCSAACIGVSLLARPCCIMCCECDVLMR